MSCHVVLVETSEHRKVKKKIFLLKSSFKLSFVYSQVPKVSWITDIIYFKVAWQTIIM